MIFTNNDPITIDDNFLPKNLYNIIIEEIQIADDDNENVIAEAKDKSVNSINGFKNNTSAPLHT